MERSWSPVERWKSSYKRDSNLKSPPNNHYTKTRPKCEWFIQIRKTKALKKFPINILFWVPLWSPTGNQRFKVFILFARFSPKKKRKNPQIIFLLIFIISLWGKILFYDTSKFGHHSPPKVSFQCTYIWSVLSSQLLKIIWKINWKEKSE